MGAPRIEADQVKEIITTTISDSTILTSMIDTAHVFVDTHLLDYDHPSAILEKIELYLAAHFVSLTSEEGALILSKQGDATDEWDTQHLGKGLSSTRFGQAALVLDSSGILAGLGTGKLKAQFRIM